MTTRLLLSSSRLALVAIAALLAIDALHGQSRTETKIQLMSEALAARDDGRLEEAREKLLKLLEIAPDDQSVRRILQDVERRIEGRSSESESAPARADRRDALQSEAERLAQMEADRIEKALEGARQTRRVALSQAERGAYDQALQTLRRAAGMVDPNPLTQTFLDQIERDRRSILRQQTSAAARRAAPAGGERSGSGQVSADFAEGQEEIKVLALRGRSQFFAGDLDGAEATFKQIESIDPQNPMAKSFLLRIAREREAYSRLNKRKTREQMLEEISRSWQRPSVFEERPDVAPTLKGPDPLSRKLEQIVIPNVNFTDVALNRVVNTLSAISEEFDDTGIGSKGVNIVLLDPNRSNPNVNITLRNLSLKRILDFIVESVGFQYEVQPDAVVLRPGGERRNLSTEVFPVSRSTVIRMTGISESPGAGQRSQRDDPFAADQQRGAASPASGMASDAATIRNFLQQAGVDFGNVEGSTLAYDGSAMIVTQTTRNLERIRNILNRYTDVKQVEIEAKFLEVQEGLVEELGFDWILESGDEVYQSSLRSLADTSSPSNVSSDILIGGEVVSTITPPSLPGDVPLGIGSVPFTNVLGNIGNVDLDVVVRALSQKSGSDLLSAPKVTVLSGNQAEINVSQEFIYPTSYSDTESEVGTTTSSLTGGSAGVTITAGTPREFQTRNVGVELAVTPIVEEDDYSITLEMNPRVTEFEGFVEYGGPNLAISGGEVVTVPSGFFQPIFAVREVATKVTIWDGATVVMGGLTREDVVTVNDKVPFLGDIPLIGRFFRSEGEGSSKRNLLIFVTANLVSPGGSPKRQDLRGVSPGSLFQNPSLVTPGGSESRAK